MDLWNNRVRELTIAARGRLTYVRRAISGNGEFLRGTRGATDETASVLYGRDAVQIHACGGAVVDLQRFAGDWQKVGRVQTTAFFVRLHLDDNTLTLFRDGRAVVTGTSDIARAKSLYARFVGT